MYKLDTARGLSFDAIFIKQQRKKRNNVHTSQHHLFLQISPFRWIDFYGPLGVTRGRVFNVDSQRWTHLSAATLPRKGTQ